MSEKEQDSDVERRSYAREDELLDAIRNSEWEMLRRHCEEPDDGDWD